MPKLKRDHVVSNTCTEVRWWLRNRLNKFKRLSHESMAVNPFMIPALWALHSHDSLDDLAELLLSGHFMTGHSTGFGKLIDEKILPNVFQTIKLDKAFRKRKPYNSSLFDEIDHLVGSGDKVEYLSLKSSRWTIQLTMAMQLNSTFSKLIDEREEKALKFKRIVVGVIYGKAADMTDKYRIIRGITTGAEHNAINIEGHVDVVVGRELWTWLNGGESATQDWVVDGILQAIAESKTDLAEAKKHLEEYKQTFADNFRQHITGGVIDWRAIVHAING